MSDPLLRQYERWECLGDGYPEAWHRESRVGGITFDGVSVPGVEYVTVAPIKDWIRELAGHRCLRCGHPYPPGIAKSHPKGEWTPCDEHCTHSVPARWVPDDGSDPIEFQLPDSRINYVENVPGHWEAQWRILTSHHLDEDKANCRWFNLLAACQRCHLSLQRRVVMDRVYSYEHKDYFKAYAAGFYALKYLNEDLSREEVMERLDELLALEHRFTQESFGP